MRSVSGSLCLSQRQHGSHEEQTRPKQAEAHVIVFIIQETDAKISPTHVSRRGWREEEGGGMQERVGLKGEGGRDAMDGRRAGCATTKMLTCTALNQ